MHLLGVLIRAERFVRPMTPCFLETVEPAACLDDGEAWKYLMPLDTFLRTQLNVSPTTQFGREAQQSCGRLSKSRLPSSRYQTYLRSIRAKTMSLLRQRRLIYDDVEHINEYIKSHL